MDADLEGMSRDQLVVEVKRLRHGIRQHRDSTGHELCWYHFGALIAATRAIRLLSRHFRLAAISPRLHTVSTITR